MQRGRRATPAWAGAPDDPTNCADIPIETVTAHGALGLYPASHFRLTTGECSDCVTIRQALWYFRGETIAVPKAGFPAAGFTQGVRVFDDIARWLQARPAGASVDYPPLVWITAPQIVRHVDLDAQGAALRMRESARPLRLVAKLPLNRSYFDASSATFFAQRAATIRGTTMADGFVARTLWPDDFRAGPLAPPQHAALPASSPELQMRHLLRAEPRGGAQSPYAATTLWQRTEDARPWTGKAVLGVMVNGAQGDDDEAHAGHFALVTGRVQPDGGIGDWLVSNFYALDMESEKGIIAAPLPLDAYLGDLNSGQGWYRPSYLLVAVLRDERAAVLVQSALNRVFNQFYRHQLDYYHPTQNCTAICLDTLRALGWTIPPRGASSRRLAWATVPFVALKQRSIAKARLVFDYLCAEQTRLLPAVALEQAYGSLLALGHGRTRPGDGPLAGMLAADLDALAFLRFPQFPSSRAWGDAPVVSTREYQARVPDDPALAQIVPVPPRPFPPTLRDPDLLPRRWQPSDYALPAWGILAVTGIALLFWLSLSG